MLITFITVQILEPFNHGPALNLEGKFFAAGKIVSC